MEKVIEDINTKYERHYASRTNLKVYPTEFVVRTMLANYPNLNFLKPVPGNKILDVGFGDGRNTVLLCDIGLDVSGIEITSGIVEQTQERLAIMGHSPDLRVGRNSSIPFENAKFDYILACHCCYYCDENQTLLDNLNEYSRVLKKDGYLIASVANKSSYIFDNAQELDDGTLIVAQDPYSNRNGYRLQAFSNKKDIETYFSPLFKNFSFGSADNEYYGITERVFWVVCQKR
ncbi:class I SAM-dependent methyltransferase [Legionella fallonii]|uniref:Methyltransferase n=1 Tax=Legionella fallonii LLAP-10 TaxID=1212491 RepID=A0A098G8P0_9GAMM|nr:class I SAM-dependent methyltransferase [Legionella fallonii]CEG58359.1 Methyltransferase [Legionella fallonii LLAP-10]